MRSSQRPSVLYQRLSDFSIQIGFGPIVMVERRCSCGQVIPASTTNVISFVCASDLGKAALLLPKNTLAMS